jgi:hypothetical protein
MWTGMEVHLFCSRTTMLQSCSAVAQQRATAPAEHIVLSMPCLVPVYWWGGRADHW